MHGEVARAFLEPKPLHQHEKSAHVIAVQMGQQNAIEIIGRNAGGAQATAHRLAAIDQQRASAQPVDKCRVPARIAGPAIARTQRVKSCLAHVAGKPIGSRGHCKCCGHGSKNPDSIHPMFTMSLG